jgi:phage shock protein PspC (stress-responsive transcriptional regulator)
VDTGCGGTTAGRTVAGMNPTAPLPSPPTPENPPPGGTGPSKSFSGDSDSSDSFAGDSATSSGAGYPDPGYTAPGSGSYSSSSYSSGFAAGRGPRSLVRPRDGRLVAGVCASVADYLGVDVLLVRVVAVVLAVSGGAGLAAYLALWALTPSSDGPAAVTPGGTGVFAAPSGPARRRAVRIAGAVVVALLVLSALAHLSHVIGWVLAFAAIVIAVVLAGRWWKVVLASLVGLLVLVGVIAGAGPSFGSRDFAVSRATDLSDDYGSPVGTVRLDLRGLTLDRSRDTTVWVGSGDVVVRVPAGLPVHVDSHAGVGSVNVFGRTASGPGAHVIADAGPAAPDVPRLEIDAVTGSGHVRVESVS